MKVEVYLGRWSVYVWLEFLMRAVFFRAGTGTTLTKPMVEVGVIWFPNHRQMLKSKRWGGQRR